MSIRFKNVRWKNFLSTGNNWTEVPLDRHRSTLIVGENGSGKCLRGGTEVDIKFKTDEAKKAFEDFLNSSK